jgi:hypothetical protein
MEEQFTLSGSTIKVWFYKKIKEFVNCIKSWSEKKIQKHEDKTIDIILVKFPSPFSMLIKYKVLNTGDKYEIVIQGYFQDAYKKYKETGEVDNNVSLIINSEHKNAFKIN